MHECCVHDDTVCAVRDALPDSARQEALADFFRVMGSSTRVGILCCLMAQEEMCVGDLSAALGMAQSAVSNQLKLLRQARLIRSRREGKMIYYALSDHHPGDIIRFGLEHIAEES
jgi:DNA-binding transcriptional ArsR family regulator